MDQQAFRQLISTPRNQDVSQSSSLKPRIFGKQNKAVERERPTQPAGLIPRKLGGGEGALSKASSSLAREKIAAINSTTGEEYVDRAEARRLGLEKNEDSDTLRKEYEQRLEEAEDPDEREELRKQLDQLSEDTISSAVVKGLDYALLAKERARLNGGEGEEINDDDLEEAYGSGGVANANAEATETSKMAATSKFRPIGSSVGFKPVGKEEEGQPEYIWRDGKRMRKKKKTPKSESEGHGERSKAVRSSSAAEMRTREGIGSAAEQSKKSVQPNQNTKEEVVQKEKEISLMPPPSLAHSKKSPTTIPISFQVVEAKGEESSESDDDDSTDIFAEAGRWNGLDEDNDEEEDGGEGETTIAAPISTSSGKRDWFSTGKEEEIIEGEGSEIALPSNLTSILDNANEAKKVHEEAKAGEASSGSEDEEKESKSERLEGFSDSILGREGVRYMLEKKDDDRNDKQRKRKRSKKGKGGYGSD